MQQRQQEQLRQRVARDILNGGDARAGIAQLIGGGDIAGATALGNFGKVDTTNAIREYNLSRSQGFPNTFTDWRNAVVRSDPRPGFGHGASNLAIPAPGWRPMATPTSPIRTVPASISGCHPDGERRSD